MTPDFDVCVVGSGAGGAPVALALAEAGKRVVVLEKGPWFKEGDFTKDEIGEVRRHRWTPRTFEEPHVLETQQPDGTWFARPTPRTGWNFWNGVAVGGATNLMSGFFARLKPDDFHLRSAYGPVEGADVMDWAIGYADLEPWYDKVEKEVGVSGRVVDHPHAEPRSSPDFPLPPTQEHAFAAMFDETCRKNGLHPIPLPRAVLPKFWRGRKGCSYSGHCGSYGCATGAKGSARAALIDRAVATGRCEVRPLTTVERLETDASGKVVLAHYRDASGAAGRVDARVFVVACQPIETARLLLLSPGSKHPRGLANGRDLVGRHLLWSPAGVGWSDFPYARYDETVAAALRENGPFVNRTLQDWYEYADPKTGARRKGGGIDFLVMHPNPVAAAYLQASLDGVGAERPVWGRPLKAKIAHYFRDVAHLKFETFSDWMPMAESRATVDPGVKDRYGRPVARVRVADHPWNHETTEFLAERGADVLRRMGADNVRVFADGSPSLNLSAGGCRFGIDPEASVLDPDCRAWECENLFVTDGSFMPTGGSVPYTWTIYANSFRVAEKIRAQLG